MGTRGAIGFRIGGKDYVSYNHFDSYPDCLGHTMIEFIQAGVKRLNGLDDFIGETKQRVRSLTAVSDDTPPTEAQKKWLAEYTSLAVSEQSTEDWYCLLREAQGDPEKMLAAKFYVGADSFLLDGLFCEFAYIVNLDDETLEFYKGFSKIDDTITGRYGSPENIAKLLADHGDETAERRKQNPGYEPMEPYGPITLVAVYPLAAVVGGEIDDLVDNMNELAHTPEEDEGGEEAA